MIFQERKKDNGYEYDVEDIFGKIHIESDIKLEPDLLDDTVVVLLRQNTHAKILQGEVKHKDGIIKYSFQKADQWEDDDEEKCENIPSSTKKQEKEPTQTTHSICIIPIWNWFVRFVGAFREAWKNQKINRGPSDSGKN